MADDVVGEEFINGNEGKRCDGSRCRGGANDLEEWMEKSRRFNCSYICGVFSVLLPSNSISVRPTSATFQVTPEFRKGGQ